MLVYSHAVVQRTVQQLQCPLATFFDSATGDEPTSEKSLSHNHSIATDSCMCVCYLHPTRSHSAVSHRALHCVLYSDTVTAVRLQSVVLWLVHLLNC